ncbi:MAG: 16S rRNA (uracil(1498)-N(3))-methyltransferase [Gammaproteobacteria bacterium RBG_16_57_12]|nr:MAG: 16S rRNA (uracil(1498)-N(3))-methyltransferase [Gammaproteobacteria bacterium RBG_16_57_12]
MRISRIYLPQPLHSGATLQLPEVAANYLLKVLRLRPGDAVTLFNGEGGEYRAVIIEADKRRVAVRVDEFSNREAESPLQIILAQGISRGERMDYTLQKAVELGVTQIIPLHTERTVVQLKGDKPEKRRAHWQGVVASACEQCGRNRVPPVAEIQTLTEWLPQVDPGALRLVLHHRAERGLKTLPAPGGPLIMLIGPEGGLSPQELTAACEAGFAPLCLGARILRTETAAVAALAAFQTLWGDFG